MATDRFAGVELATNVLNTTGHYTLTTPLAQTIIVLTTDGSYNLLLPTEADSSGAQIFISNDQAGQTVQVQTDAGVAIGAVIAADTCAGYACDGTTWYRMGVLS